MVTVDLFLVPQSGFLIALGDEDARRHVLFKTLASNGRRMHVLERPESAINKPRIEDTLPELAPLREKIGKKNMRINSITNTLFDLEGRSKFGRSQRTPHLGTAFPGLVPNYGPRSSG